jgi:hypothetical protein
MSGTFRLAKAKRTSRSFQLFKGFESEGRCVSNCNQ